MANKNNDLAAVRIDKWLWAARFFKTRSIATDAVSGGKVHLNGERMKPSRKVQVGDELLITKGPYQFVVNVEALSERRLSAPLAAELYQETDASREKRELLAEQLKMERAGQPMSSGRPDKKQRRDIQKARSQMNYQD